MMREMYVTLADKSVAVYGWEVGALSAAGLACAAGNWWCMQQAACAKTRACRKKPTVAERKQEEKNEEEKQKKTCSMTSPTSSSTNNGSAQDVATYAAPGGIRQIRTVDYRINSIVRTTSTAGSTSTAATRLAVSLVD